jgi:hypothetical protein
MALKIGKISRWPEAKEYEVIAGITRDFAWDQRKLFMTHGNQGWTVTRCLNWGERIGGFPTPEACKVNAN